MTTSVVVAALILLRWTDAVGQPRTRPTGLAGRRPVLVLLAPRGAERPRGLIAAVRSQLSDLNARLVVVTTVALPASHSDALTVARQLAHRYRARLVVWAAPRGSGPLHLVFVDESGVQLLKRPIGGPTEAERAETGALIIRASLTAYQPPNRAARPTNKRTAARRRTLSLGVGTVIRGVASKKTGGGLRLALAARLHGGWALALRYHWAAPVRFGVAPVRLLLTSHRVGLAIRYRYAWSRVELGFSAGVAVAFVNPTVETTEPFTEALHVGPDVAALFAPAASFALRLTPRLRIQTEVGFEVAAPHFAYVLSGNGTSSVYRWAPWQVRPLFGLSLTVELL